MEPDAPQRFSVTAAAGEGNLIDICEDLVNISPAAGR